MRISQAFARAIVASEAFQHEIIGPMIESFVHRLSRPGEDGKTYRSFIIDWLYFERPMLDRFIGEQFNVQFEGPALHIEGTGYPLGGFIERQIEWVRLDPIAAFELRTRLRKAVDAAVTDWIDGRPMKFLPAIVEKPSRIGRQRMPKPRRSFATFWVPPESPKGTADDKRDCHAGSTMGPRCCASRQD